MTIGITHAVNMLSSDLKRWGTRYNIEIKFDQRFQYIGFLKVKLPNNRAYELFCLSWDSGGEWILVNNGNKGK